MTNFLKYENPTFVTFADYNTLHFCSQDLQTVIENLTYDVKNVLNWFKIKYVKAYPEKFQFMILSKTRRPEHNLLIDSNVMKESADMELLGLIIDNKLSFEKHIARLCQTACTQANKNTFNIRKYQSLGKCFFGFSIQLCASNSDVLQENYLFQNTANLPQSIENHLSVR